MQDRRRTDKIIKEEISLNEIKGDIWERWEYGHWIVIPTSGSVKRNGEAVMGRGLALQAKQNFPDLAMRLGKYLLDYGNNICFFENLRLISFPVKRFYFDEATLELIERSCKQTKEFLNENYAFGNEIKITWPIYLPKVGCGNGGLKWEDVKPILEKYFDEEKFVVCDES